MATSPTPIETVQPTVPVQTFQTREVASTVTVAPSDEEVDIVQFTPQLSGKMVKARELLLRDRALKRMERRERNHQLAEETCRAGDALLENGDYSGASAHYIDASNLWPSNSGFYLKLTEAYLKCEQHADAAHAATRALSFEPTSLEARYQRGIARLEQGLLPAAKIDFETVIAHNTEHALAHTSLGRTLTLLQATKIGTHVLSPPPRENMDSDGKLIDFSFPHYEDDKLELAEHSDSSDCNHVGNGVPCRFYNHDGCARGPECDFSHGPDEKSVRDDLGKNVCLYFLLSACKFGELKCIYSHSKDALPTTHGWWNDVGKIKRVKDVLDMADKQAKEQRALEILLHRMEARKVKSKSRGKGQTGDGKGKPKERGGKGKSKVDALKVGEPIVDKLEDGSACKLGTEKRASSMVKEVTVPLRDAEVPELNGGFTDYELAAHGVKPYDDDASAVLAALSY